MGPHRRRVGFVIGLTDSPAALGLTATLVDAHGQITLDGKLIPDDVLPALA
jgi:hypothetical protein